jgi:hypothetical protein
VSKKHPQGHGLKSLKVLCEGELDVNKEKNKIKVDSMNIFDLFKTIPSGTIVKIEIEVKNYGEYK